MISGTMFPEERRSQQLNEQRKLVEQLRKEAKLSRIPLSQVIMVWGRNLLTELKVSA